MIDLDVVRRAWDLPPLLATSTPATGTVHQTLLLKTERGSYALRGYCYSAEQVWRIASEHAVIAFVRTHDLPAIAPLPLRATGATMLEDAGSFYALFPLARGRQLRRNQLTFRHIAALGNFLAWLHQTLRDYPVERVPGFPFSVDHASTLTRIDEIIALIHAQPSIDAVDRSALTRLAQRRAWLSVATPVDVARLQTLKQQVIHGDYQESNIFFEADSVSAIIDWDGGYPAPRAWEVVRALHYLFGFSVAESQIFLSAYRTVWPLPLSELECAASVYAWIREHDLWVFEELYARGNPRVSAFVRPGNFVPISQRWQTLQTVLL